jgi:flavin-binding protein dodecin
MDEDVYKKVEIVGTSHESVSDAIDQAIERARETVNELRWFEVKETRGYVDDEGELEYQVTLKIGFKLD